MLSILMLGVTLAHPLPLAPAAPALGPPAVCFPVEIGAARSLPWGDDGAFSVSSKYDTRQLPTDAVALLDESQDTLAHMETLRRAAIYLSGTGRRTSESEQLANRARGVELVSMLRARVIEAVLAEEGEQPLTERAAALRWFDLGYLLAALDQIGGAPRQAFAPALERALELSPDDGALRLGLALGLWFDDEARWKHLDAACQRSTGDDALAISLVGTAGRILSCSSHEELRAAIRRQLD